ncbi:IS110 family transposase, partial [Paraburkholderia caribensis]
RKLVARGKTAHVAIIAVARELAAFIWDVGRLGMNLAVQPDEQAA